MMKKIVIYLLPVLFLAACSNSSDSNSGKQGFRSENLTPEISKQFSSFIESESELVSMIAVSMSNDNTIHGDHLVGPGAPKEVKDNCTLNTARNMVAKDISWATSEMKGDQCPLDVYQKFGAPKPDSNVKEEWTNTYVLKSADYQKEYGFTQIIEKEMIQTKTPAKGEEAPKTNLTRKEMNFYLLNGNVVTATYTHSWITSKDSDDSSSSHSLAMNGDVFRSEGTNHYDEKNKNQSSRKFYFNDKEITEDEYQKAGGPYFQYFW